MAIIGASTGMLGTARAQYHLRQCFVTLNMYPVNYPEVFVGHAKKRFDGSGQLYDEKARKLLAELLENLIDWTVKLRRVK